MTTIMSQKRVRASLPMSWKDWWKFPPLFYKFSFGFLSKSDFLNYADFSHFHIFYIPTHLLASLRQSGQSLRGYRWQEANCSPTFPETTGTRIGMIGQLLIAFSKFSKTPAGQGLTAGTHPCGVTIWDPPGGQKVPKSWVFRPIW